MSQESEAYLGYLDREMTIMGILSAFCAAVPALILERLASAQGNELAEIWSRGEWFFWSASVLMLCSAALFYKQRSLLAFYYGRIALGKPLNGESASGLNVWKDLADSWTTWIPYQAGFGTGVAAAVEYAFAFLAYKHPCIREHDSCYECFVVLLLVAWLGLMVATHKDRSIRWQGNPWVDGIGRIWNGLRKKKGQ